MYLIPWEKEQSGDKTRREESQNARLLNPITMRYKKASRAKTDPEMFRYEKKEEYPFVPSTLLSAGWQVLLSLSWRRRGRKCSGLCICVKSSGDMGENPEDED